MALKLNFREVTPEDTEILRMIALRNGKAEDYLCCDVTNEDGVTQTTWYSKADVALWGGGLYPGAHHNEVQRL